MKNLLLGLLLLMAGINCSQGQSRGRKYWLNPNAGIQIFGAPNFPKPSTFEIANENIMVFTPRVKQNGQFYSLLTKFDNNLCYQGTKKVVEYTTNLQAFGVSKNDGGFATCSWSSPYVIRNYDNQGNLLFCKKIVDTNTYQNGGGYGISNYGKMVANPDNNNLYMVNWEFSNEVHDSIPNLVGSPLINIVEISPTGNLVNTVQCKIPYYSRTVNGNGRLIVNTWNHITEITDAKYVKGPFGPASDRIWVTMDLSPAYDYFVDSNNEITSQQSFPVVYNLPQYTAIVVIQPYGTSGEVALLTDGPSIIEESIVESAPSVPGAYYAGMMLLRQESSIPYIYEFGANSPIPYYFKNKLPIVATGVSGEGVNLKYHQGTVLFGVGKYFGTFNNFTDELNIRVQSVSNAPILGQVNYVTRNTNKLYINYRNTIGPTGPSNSNNYMNFITKENLLTDFKYTCASDPYLIKKTLSVVANYSTLTAFTQPFSGVSLVNEPYTEITDNNLTFSQDVCLRGCAAGKLSSEVSENLDILLNPNPAKNYFELTTDLTIEKVEVYSMLGQLVKTFDKQGQYSISELSKGSYIVKIITTEGISNKTLIIE